MSGIERRTESGDVRTFRIMSTVCFMRMALLLLRRVVMVILV